jgi:hypothetical protein
VELLPPLLEEELPLLLVEVLLLEVELPQVD